MARWGNGPGWTIEQAMQVLTVLHPAFRENGYALAMHGSVSRDGKGNDLDLIAVPEELCVTPPDGMERIMCDLIALPLTLNATSPEAMDHLIFEKLQAPLLSDPVESSMSIRSYHSDDDRKIGIRFARPAVVGDGGDNVDY